MHCTFFNVCCVTPGFQDPSCLYTSHTSHLDMIDAISSVIEEEIDNKIQNSPFVGLVIDESTDVSVYKKLAVYVRVVSAGRPSMHFVRNMDIPDGKAATIVNALHDFAKSKGLDFAKVSSLASDGASVMTGKHNGVGARLRENSSPYLIQIHCAAHRLALAAADACRFVSYFDEFQRLLKQVYFYYSTSAVRYEGLRELQRVLEDNPTLKTISLKEPASFRWLSLHQAVKAFHSVYPALCLHLEEQASAKNASDAKGLLTKLKSVKCVLTMAFLSDVVETLTRMSKIFQVCIC